ncbi:hypothetical protein VPNG_04093 [Cytospora leucostoma]|uniref:Uncharacterized protein n=1 Tax=Cytospora leucostoma TaxID=1230097 RepID=A0A423XD40_9PEZI|nr:hypothetical protein VPNG_04093 [Cytospora leucostoma]
MTHSLSAPRARPKRHKHVEEPIYTEMKPVNINTACDSPVAVPVSTTGSEQPHDEATFSNGSASQATMMGNQEQTSGPPLSGLESLPAEVRIHVLCNMSNLQTLGALLHASPIYYAQYRYNRKVILAQVIHSDLGDELFTDVYAAFRSRASKIGPRKGPNVNVTDFLSLYRAWRSPGGERPTPDMCSLDDLRWMACFHTSIVRPLVSRFVARALARKPGPSSVSSSDSASFLQSDIGDRELSGTESTRLLRALYRLETFCHLFGGSQYQSSAFMGQVFSPVFFSDFDPWEVEEICCVHDLVKDRYEKIVAEVRWEFDEKNPKFADDLSFEPQGSFAIERDYDGTPACPPASHLRGSAVHPLILYGRSADLTLSSTTEFLNGTIGRGGLRLALHMFTTETHNDLVALMEKSLSTIQHHFFTEASSMMAQWNRRDMARLRGLTDNRECIEQRREALTFVGDDSAQPPLAWVLLWGGKYSNLYGEYVPVELRRRGYVMWDEGRLDVKAAREYFARLWAESPELKEVKEDWPHMCDVFPPGSL